MAYESVVIATGPLKEQIQEHPCYFGDIDRETAEKLLLNRGEDDGCFLVRKGVDGDYKLSMISADETVKVAVLHYKIIRSFNRTYCIDNTVSFVTVHQLIRYYSGKKTGLRCKLSTPCPKYDQIAEFSHLISAVKKSSIDMKSQVSHGEFAVLHQANYMGMSVVTRTHTPHHRTELVNQANLLHDIVHKNIVQVIGVIKDSPSSIVFEYCHNRDLLDYMLSGQKYEIAVFHRVQMAIQISRGLEHLAHRQILHRNIRATSVLVDRYMSCKIASFGYAVTMDKDGKYVKSDDDRPFEPQTVRWMAPEGIVEGHFYTASDVWSYACLLIEIFTNGEAPFSGELIQHVLPKVQSGFRVGKPAGTPQEIYNVMLRCWHPTSSSRPDFTQIQTFFSNLPAKAKR